MAPSKTSKVRIKAADRRVNALELRKSGCTFREIGRELGFSEQRAHKIVSEELARLNSERNELASDVLRLELERLDILQKAVWDDAAKGDVQRINTVLNIMQRRARLLGIDKAQATVMLGKLAEAEQYAQMDVQLERLTDEELQRVIDGDSVKPLGSAPLLETT